MEVGYVVSIAGHNYSINILFIIQDYDIMSNGMLKVPKVSSCCMLRETIHFL